MLQHAALQGRPAPPVGSRLRAAPAAAHQRSLVVRPAAQKETVSSALESLDALLSDGEEQQPRGAAKPEPPARTPRTATRQTSTQAFVESRFMNIDRNWSKLAVGQQTEVGATSAQLPAAEPLVSTGVALWASVASCAVALFPSLFPVEASVMYPDLAAEGSLHQFLTASFICPTLANCALAVLLMLTAGGQAERLLGRSRFAAVYLLAGASANLGYFALAGGGDPSAYFCGTAGGLVGVCAALAAIALKNRRVLTLGQAAGILGTAAGGAAAAVAGDALLWGDHTFIPGAYAAAAASGAVLGAAFSPRYYILREVLIPDGSVEVPDDAPEVQVVVDKTTGLQQWGATVAYSLVLGILALAITGAPADEALADAAGSEELVHSTLRALLRSGGPGAASAARGHRLGLGVYKYVGPPPW